ncbi:hypothetical protein [Chryseobacterium sp. G0240]|uniref:hypothetical protein n=1 Tax=Chryseobacterium sp. G0240 TaxID=2487066 RepID=UPI0011CDB79C|nr:hypothetical protein [Chryseobacterium sp. G0240]
MNYIKEINSFYDWLELNSVSDSVITLWHAMMHINNKAGWKVEFTVAISTLQVKTSLSKSSIIRARNVLKQLGRIDFKERKGNQSCVYKIIAFHCDTQTETQHDTEFVTQTDTQTVTQTDTINKLNYTKLNNVLLEKEPKEEKLEKENFQELFFDEPIKTKKESSSKKVAQKKVSEKFTPPSVQVVQDYCNERKNGISGYSFVNFYQSKGWMVGKNKMKDWKAAVRTWEQKNEENGKSNNFSTNNRSGSKIGNSSGSFKTSGKVSARTLLARRIAQNSSGDSESGNITIDVEAIE